MKLWRKKEEERRKKFIHVLSIRQQHKARRRWKTFFFQAQGSSATLYHWLQNISIFFDAHWDHFIEKNHFV
jgi:hypothetical protein